MSDGFITSASEYTGGGADFSQPAAAAAEPVAQTEQEQQHHHQEAPVQGNEGDGEGIMVNILIFYIFSSQKKTFKEN